MQGWCPKLRSIAALHSTITTTTKSLLHSHRLLHSSPNLPHRTFTVPVISSNFKPVFIAPSTSQLSLFNHVASPLPLSYKGRFRTMKDGQIRYWKEGKRHNAHLKSKKSKRRLRQPGSVPLAYAKVMEKLNFCT